MKNPRLNILTVDIYCKIENFLKKNYKGKLKNLLFDIIKKADNKHFGKNKKIRFKKNNIKYDSSINIIYGKFVGGPEGDGKNAVNKNDKKETPLKDTIIEGEYFFVLYFPKGKSKGILILQDYYTESMIPVFCHELISTVLSKDDKKVLIIPFTPNVIREKMKEGISLGYYSFNSSKKVKYGDGNMEEVTKDFDIEINVKPPKGENITYDDIERWITPIKDMLNINDLRDNKLFLNIKKGKSENQKVNIPMGMDINNETKEMTPTIYLSLIQEINENINLVGPNGEVMFDNLEFFLKNTLLPMIEEELFKEKIKDIMI